MPLARLRSLAVAATTVALGVSGVALGSVPATAASTDLLISEIYGGGGNSGAVYVNDFVELANRGGEPVSLAGLSLQYGASGGFLGGGSTPGSGSLKVDLEGTVPAGTTFLVQLAAGSGNGAALPTPDQASSAINLSGTNGKLALVRSTSVLACGNDCDADPAVVDFLGYGSANDAEGQPAQATTNATSSARGGGADTDDNSADFTTGAPTPVACGCGSPGPDPLPRTIPQLQGPGHLSPDDGELVVTKGVVTARKFDGYWIQDPTGDGDDLTSDGVFVYTQASGAKPTVGQTVEVTGTVNEFRPSSLSGPNLMGTELEDSTFTVLPETHPVPVPVLIGPGGRVAPAQNADSGPTARTDIELPGAEFLPSRDAVDFYETLEGMLVSVRDAKVVGPGNSFGELVVVPGGTTVPAPTASNGVRYSSYALPNTQRLTIDDEIVFRQMPPANVGDSLPGTVSGPLAYNFGMFRMYPTAVPSVQPGGLQKEVFTGTSKPDELTVSTFNVENLDPQEPQAKYDRLASTIVTNLGTPDVVALEEVQDNTGAECPNGPSPTCTPDGVVDADQTLAKLVAAISAAGGPAYEWRQISPQNLTDGGEPTGNIRVAFLFRTDRGVRFVDRPGGSATSAVAATRIRGKVALTQSPGRIDPTNTAWNASRKPLAGEFTFRGQTLFVIANHFNSKGGDDPLMGRWQPPVRVTETQRHQQAQAVNSFVRSLLAVDASARVAVVGDINDFEFSETTSLLESGDALVDLPQELPANERYSYVFDGNSQILDHILVSRALMGTRRPGPWPPAPSPSSGIRAYQIVHVNAEFADQVSDHDPQVVRLALHARP